VKPDFMRHAIRIAQQALPLDVPVGALLLSAEGELLAKAHNRREIDQNPVGHAEILLLQAAAERLGHWRLEGTILYVTLEPCPMCASAIAQARVGKVIFGAYDPVLGACGSRWNLLQKPVEVDCLGGLLETECQALLKTFFQHRRLESS
jgi:tRNA(adenine34) deaminase